MSKGKAPASIYTALRIPPELREKAEKKAAKSGRSLSNYIRSLIADDLKAAGLIREDEPDYVAGGGKKKK